MELGLIQELLNGCIVKGAGGRIDNEDLDQAIRSAVSALEISRPHFGNGEILLVSQQSLYEALPSDFLKFSHADWGTEPQTYFGRVKVYPRPHILTEKIGGNAKGIRFSPAPSQAQINAWGNQFGFVYVAKHDQSLTTIADEDEDLLLVYALASLMKMLAGRNVVNPIQLHHGMGNVPKDATPALLYQSLMAEYRRQAKNG